MLCMLRAAAARRSWNLRKMTAFASLPRTAMGMSTNAAAAEPEVLMAAMGGLRVVDLNRPKALNALTITMIRELYPFLVDWNRMGGDVNVRLPMCSPAPRCVSLPSVSAPLGWATLIDSPDGHCCSWWFCAV